MGAKKNKGDNAIELIPVAGGKYQVSVPLGIYSSGIGDIDLNNLTEEKAEELVKLGFIWISKVE